MDAIAQTLEPQSFLDASLKNTLKVSLVGGVLSHIFVILVFGAFLCFFPANVQVNL